jgi:hypothetical protein
MTQRMIGLVVLWAWGSFPFACAGAEPGPAAVPGRVFPASKFDIDQILKRPYTPEVPFGTSGDRLWASSPQGWAFRNDVHFLYLTNLNAYDLNVLDRHGLYGPSGAVYYPSHVHLEGLKREQVATASFTYVTDNVLNPLTKPFVPGKRWTCWSSGRRRDWYAVDYGPARKLQGVKVWFFDDAPTGGCRPPEEVVVQVWKDGAWAEVARSKDVKKGENHFPFKAVETGRVRLEFRNAGKDFYTGLYGLEPQFEQRAEAEAPALPDVRVSADKFITADDLLITSVAAVNRADQPREVTLRLTVPWAQAKQSGTSRDPNKRPVYKAQGNARLHDIPVRYVLQARADSDRPGDLDRTTLGISRKGDRGEEVDWRLTLSPGATGRLLVAMAVLPEEEDPTARLREVFDRGAQATARQAARYQKWFDDNIAYFDCSDPDITRMYYHRWYVLKKNAMEPKVGRLRWKCFAEGRWRTTWYPNVISYGAGHQIREARWLADPSYWQGHLRTFAHNPRPDGVYPSHVTPKGQRGGQYTDWITSTALDGYRVHPDRRLLEELAEPLAANARGWDKVYAHPGTHLLVVDSHWWTGMEWQPSFFAFGDYKTDPKERSMPRVRTPLMRVDLTAYNYGNARAVARIHELLGQPDKAREFAELARRTKEDVQRRMWDPDGRFFYSLRAADGKKADVKEVIGVYPFYFDLPDAGKGYERAWESILDPKQFWTPWPVASASRQCPAYSQDGWPGDPASGTACMWNGPTWPHANSLVLSAMANTLRHYPAGALRREHLFELFRSFTRAQFRDQDRGRPWTGEYYNGDNARWKTNERDYNHSTYNDVLIGELLGIVPRSDEVLEIDPLLPAGALDRFVLDGQAYHGHRVSLRWDKGGPQGRRFEVWIDGKPAGGAGELKRLFFDLKTGKELAKAPADS